MTIHQKQQDFAGYLCDLTSPFTLTPGIYPNTCTIRMTSDTIGPMGNMIGDLALTVGSTSVTIKDLVVIGSKRQEEIVNGSPTGRYVIDMTLADRRCRWKYGHLTGGPYNKRAEDGKGIVPGTLMYLGELVAKCLDAMWEKNEPNQEGEEYIFSVDDDPIVPDVEWAFDNPAEALQQLLDAGNLLIALNADATITIHKKGQGAEPTSVPSGDKEYATPAEADSGRPDCVIVTSAPNRCINEVKITGWIPVGEEEDGTVKPVDELTYTPSQGWKTAIAYNFDHPEYGDFDLTDAQRKLAEKCIGKWYRMPLIGSGEDNEKKLPILEQRVTVKDGKRLPPLVEAKSFRETHNLWKNFDKSHVSEGYDIDYRRGIVMFHQVMGQVEETNACHLHKAGIAAWADVDVTFAYELREGNEDDYYHQAFGEELGITEIVRVPEMIEYQINGAAQNMEELEQTAYKIAAPRLKTSETIDSLEQRCKGCHRVDLNGIIERVTWDGSLTTYTTNNALPTADATSLWEKEHAARIQVQRQAAEGHRRIEPVGTGLGSGDRARSGTGGGSSLVLTNLPRTADLWKKVDGDDEGPFRAVRILQDGTEIGDPIEGVYPADQDVADDDRGWIGLDADGKVLFFSAKGGTIEYVPNEDWIAVELSAAGGKSLTSRVVQNGSAVTEKRVLIGGLTSKPCSILVPRLGGGIYTNMTSVTFIPGWITQPWNPQTVTWGTQPAVIESMSSVCDLAFSSDSETDDGTISFFSLSGEAAQFSGVSACYGVRVRAVVAGDRCDATVNTSSFIVRR